VKRLRATWFLAGLSFLVSCAGPARAAEFPDKPPKQHFYVDQAGLLNPQDAQAVDQAALQLLREQRVPILVVTIPSLLTYRAADLSVEQYARALFDHWGIGSPSRNYGILLLVSLGDRKARIELGAAWEGKHDGDAQYIMDSLIVPSFKAGDYSGGIRQGVEALDKMARGLGLPRPKQPWWALPVFAIAVALTIGVIVSLFRSGRRGWGWALIAALGILLVFMLRAAAKGGGSGGSFGGGSGGGGGASGSW
jgi:uncharacterized protein